MFRKIATTWQLAPLAADVREHHQPTGIWGGKKNGKCVNHEGKTFVLLKPGVAGAAPARWMEPAPQGPEHPRGQW